MACPLLPVERRLQDAVSLWTEALDCYFDPERFRVKLQAAIQSFRSVTWVLQSQKAVLPGFDVWYETKQQSMRSDPKMRWLVEARNYIEKQGDLSTRSRFLVTFSNSWDSELVREFKFGPDVMPKDVVELIANSIPDAKITEAALLKFDRAWVDSMLPEEEVLTTLIHCFLVLQSVVDSAHELINPETECADSSRRKQTNDVLPAAMVGLSFPATKWFKVRRGLLVDYDIRKIVYGREDLAKYAAEQPAVAEAAKGLELAGTFREKCEAFFEMARVLLVRDGYHITTVIFEAGGIPQFWHLQMDDRAEKHVLMREIATVCRRHQATWFIMIGEAWLAIPHQRYGPHAANYPNRKEALVLHGVHRDGSQLSCVALFSKVNGKTVIGPTTVNDELLPGIMRPIVQVIRSSQR